LKIIRQTALYYIFNLSIKLEMILASSYFFFVFMNFRRPNSADHRFCRSKVLRVGGFLSLRHTHTHTHTHSYEPLLVSISLLSHTLCLLHTHIHLWALPCILSLTVTYTHTRFYEPFSSPSLSLSLSFKHRHTHTLTHTHSHTHTHNLRTHACISLVSRTFWQQIINSDKLQKNNRLNHQKTSKSSLLHW